jgi:hypothetical protein
MAPIVFADKEIQNILDLDLPNTVDRLATLWNNHAPASARIAPAEVKQTLASGMLAVCPSQAVHVGGSGLNRKALCASLSAITLMVISAGAFMGLPYVYMLIDKFMLCSTYDHYIKGITSWILIGKNTCSIYADIATQLKSAIDGPLFKIRENLRTENVSVMLMITLPTVIKAIECSIGIMVKSCACHVRKQTGEVDASAVAPIKPRRSKTTRQPKT